MAPLSAALSLSSPGSSEEQGIMSASLNLNQLRPIHFSNFSFIFSSNNYFLRETLLLYKFVTIFTFHFTTNTENKGLVKLSLKGGFTTTVIDWWTTEGYWGSPYCLESSPSTSRSMSSSMCLLLLYVWNPEPVREKKGLSYQLLCKSPEISNKEAFQILM